MLLTRATTIIFLFLLSFTAIADTSNPALLKRGMPGEKRGDIIAPVLDEQIAAWCDFNKQIVITKTNVLCAYIGNKASTVSQTTPLTASPKLTTKKNLRPIPKDLTPTLYEMSEYGEEA